MEDNTNYPSNNPPKIKEKKDFLLITLLVVGLLGTWGFFFFSKHKSEEKIKEVETRYIYVDSTRNAVEIMYGAALTRLDSLVGQNTSLKSELKGRDGKIGQLKERITQLLRKEKLNLDEISQAYNLIGQLNVNIDELRNKVNVLTETNQKLNENIVEVQGKNVALSTELTTVKEDNQKLNETVDYGSTLYANNILVKPYNVKKNGKYKETDKYNKIDELVVSFDIENRLLDGKETEVYVLIVDPKNNFIETGRNLVRGIGDVPYTGIVKVVNGRRNRVEFVWKKGPFLYGVYRVKIYHNGYIIGENVCELRKSGIFGL